MARRAGGGECIQQRSPTRADDLDQPSSASQELHVLAVDDSHVDRKVIERLLKISSCRVTAVESGSRALQYLGLNGDKKCSVGFDVNLILTDYSMPGMSGYELLKKIKESSHLREIPVVIMSSENILARIDRDLKQYVLNKMSDSDHLCGTRDGSKRHLYMAAVLFLLYLNLCSKPECLEEGAEEFLVKPVKLSDVNRLKDYILREQGEENGGRGKRKRNLQDDYTPPSPSLSLQPT